MTGERSLRMPATISFFLPLCLLASFAQGDLHVHLALVADHGHRHSVSGLMLVQDGHEVLLIGNLVAIDRDDEVSAEHDRNVADVCLLIAATQSGTIGGSTGRGLYDQHAVIR